MSRMVIIALGKKCAIKYAEKTTSYTEDKTWQKSKDILHNMFSEIGHLERILAEDTNIDFSDFKDDFESIMNHLQSISSEITFRVGNLYGAVDPGVHTYLDLNKEHQKFRK